MPEDTRECWTKEFQVLAALPQIHKLHTAWSKHGAILTIVSKPCLCQQQALQTPKRADTLSARFVFSFLAQWQCSLCFHVQVAWINSGSIYSLFFFLHYLAPMKCSSSEYCQVVGLRNKTLNKKLYLSMQYCAAGFFFITKTTPGGTVLYLWREWYSNRVTLLWSQKNITVYPTTGLKTMCHKPYIAVYLQLFLQLN